MTKPLTKTEQVLKIHPTPGAHPAKAPSTSRKKAFKPRVRAPNEALPITSMDWRKSTYTAVRKTPMRPGAEDALACPSRSGNLYYYPLTKELGPRKS